jgi:hypothetical protein
MKKFFIFFVLCLISLTSKAQFATYHSIDQYQTAQSAPIQSVSGYVRTSQGWVRISIRVKEANDGILVVGYKQKDTSTYGGAFATYGSSNQWIKCKTWAESVSVFSDGREIANNFDYKVYISGIGKVYF